MSFLNRFRSLPVLALAGVLAFGLTACDNAIPEPDPIPTPDPTPDPNPDPSPTPTPAASTIGAGYPNAGDSRVVLVNTDGDRFLLINLVTGAVTDADDLDDLENGLIPISDVGASANVFGEEETYFFAADGDTFTHYERDTADFDAPASFAAEYDESGYDLTSIGAAFESGSDDIILFNQNGTQYQIWFVSSDSFSDVFSFPSEFGSGGSPISAVGAAFWREESNQYFLFNRDGSQYTIYSDSGSGSWSAAFPVSELGALAF